MNRLDLYTLQTKYIPSFLCFLLLVHLRIHQLKKKKKTEEIQSKTMNYKPADFHLDLFKSTYGHIYKVEKFCNLILIHLSCD